MKTMTLKNIPEPLLERVRLQAERNHRSVNQEVLSCLDRVVAPPPVDVDAVLKRVEALHARMKPIKTTHEQMTRFKRMGRL